MWAVLQCARSSVICTPSSLFCVLGAWILLVWWLWLVAGFLMVVSAPIWVPRLKSFSSDTRPISPSFARFFLESSMRPPRSERTPPSLIRLKFRTNVAALRQWHKQLQSNNDVLVRTFRFANTDIIGKRISYLLARRIQRRFKQWWIHTRGSLWTDLCTSADQVTFWIRYDQHNVNNILKHVWRFGIEGKRGRQGRGFIF